MAGSGYPHRYGLDDAILIKDNHIAANGGNIIDTLKMALKHRNPMVKIEIEVDTLEQFEDILPLKPDIVLLDNMPVEDLKTAVEKTQGAFLLEASGGISIDTVEAIAKTGIDIISIGALTHSVRAIDFGLDAL